MTWINMGDIWVIYFRLNSDVRPLAVQCCVQHLNTGVYQTVLLRASYGIRSQVIDERWEIDTEHAVRDPIDKDNAELFVDEIFFKQARLYFRLFNEEVIIGTYHKYMLS